MRFRREFDVVQRHNVRIFGTERQLRGAAPDPDVYPHPTRQERSASEDAVRLHFVDINHHIMDKCRSGRAIEKYWYDVCRIFMFTRILCIHFEDFGELLK